MSCDMIFNLFVLVKRIDLKCMNVFVYGRDRDRYIQGDYQFRYCYCKHNPRKMVKTWAEKEMRNLLRWDIYFHAIFILMLL
jgi:hypothetical protein